MRITRSSEALWYIRTLVLGLALGLLTSVGVRAQDIGGTGTVVVAAPVYILPDATRTPLTTLTVGTVIKVLSKEGTWYRVTFHDSTFGDRTGYTPAVNVRVDSAQPAQTPTRATGSTGRTTTQPDARSAAAPGPFLTPQVANRGIVSLNGGRQGTSTAFTGATTFTQNAETGTVTTNYGGAHPLVIDLGGTAHVWRDFGVTVAATWSSQTRDAAVAAAIPHPFQFNAPRNVSGTAPVKRQEIAVHVDPSLLVPVRDVAQLVIFGGPSFFHMTQGVVTGVTAVDAYPYDTAAFSSATVVDASRSRLGFNVGVDVGVYLAKSVGVGAIVRYSRATLNLTTGEGGDVKVRGGGTQVGGGLRFRF